MVSGFNQMSSPSPMSREDLLELAALDALLAGSAQIYNFAAIGQYDGVDTMTAGIVGVVLN